MTTPKPILVVEDSLPDYESIMRAFKKMNLENPVFRCESGEEAMDFLNHLNGYKDESQAPRPSVILLDLNLPGMDGRSVLAKIKASPDLQSIPVIILTTSDSARDVGECYKLGANSYIVKPVDWERFMESMNNFKSFWLHTAILPDKEVLF